MATVLVEDQVEIPGTVATLTAFRHWALSESFPKRGRIDWVGSQIEVDMSPEDLFTYGTLKTAIVCVAVAACAAQGLQPLHRPDADFVGRGERVGGARRGRRV
jgi:hypothetical protein